MQDDCANEHYKEQVREHIIRTLSDCGFEVNPLANRNWFHSHNVDYTKWTVDSDSSIDCPDPFDRYTGLEDLDIPASYWRDKEFVAVELKTPKMTFNERSLLTITKALDILNHNFVTLTNKSCGLHVHVGNAAPFSSQSRHSVPKSPVENSTQRSTSIGDNISFPLQTIKSIATLATVFTRQFNSLHPLHRVDNVYCEPPAFYFGSSNPSTIAKDIANTRKLDALIGLMRPDSGTSPALNFVTLATPQLRTLEFRQHEATLDASEVRLWVSLVCEFVLAAHRLTSRQLTVLVLEYAARRNADFGIVQLLRKLGLVELARMYRERGTFDHPKEKWNY